MENRNRNQSADVIRQRNRQTILKTVIVASIIVGYIAVLNIISHVRSPLQYYVEKNAPLVVAGDFVSFAGERPKSDVLILSNPNEGTAVGYSRNIELFGIKEIQVSFDVVCPIQYAGSTIIIDLYNPDAGYDFPEQEKIATLQEGENEIIAILPLGEDAPEEAQLRFFTENALEVSIRNIAVYQLLPLPKVTLSMVVVALAAVSVFLLSGYMYQFSNGKKKCMEVL